MESHPLSDNPHRLWEEIWSKQRVCQPFQPPRLSDPIKENCLRFVCISDTHEKLGKVLAGIPPGDVLVHCGDFTNFGEAEEIKQFDLEMAQLPHRHKIVVAGNHELGFEDGEDLALRDSKYVGRGTARGYELLKNCVYLQDSSITELLECWKKIPDDVDVLLTHTPPLGHLDLFCGERWGCADLLEAVEKRVKPKYHVFGHVHENPGCTTNGTTVFVNAANCNNSLEPANPPIVFDLEIPKGFQK
uniref:Calcineurin-like phosphoesterase domain-containing protein n=1 Tax=Panagrolaimus sp. JU765 TaxID=591449 RepID=A0AC34QEX5_9BILA